MTSTTDYWVGSTIGEGAFGKVVYGKHKQTRKDVAIKVVTKLQMKKDPNLMRSIMRERRLLSELKSDFVVALWASFHDSECVYFVMECSTGGNLSHLIETGVESESEHWRQSIPYYGLQLVSALEFIHSRRIIHGDLKPDNVLATPTGKLRLADFGSAIEIDDPQHSNLAIAGTADYSSPEVVRGLTCVSVGIDLWSLGCILFAMWEGDSPFHDKSDALSIQNIVGHDGRQRLDAKYLDDEAWMTIIQELLVPEPFDRLGLSDVMRNRASTNVVYSSIRGRPCWKSWSKEDCTVPFRAPSPLWWIENKDATLGDGAEGWALFLL